MVQTLTRHGTRAPDRIVGETICKPVFDAQVGIRRSFVNVFGVGATELTGVGVRQMRDVGFMLRERYHGFVSGDYGPHSNDWEFMAKSGTRQQRSMMAIVLGMFPNDVVPIDVPDKRTDAILGGPAAACSSITHAYITEWHRTKGRQLVQEYASLIARLEQVCNISLIDDPMSQELVGANPHAYIGDISDLMDSLKEARYGALLPISDEDHRKLSELAFRLEQGAHYDFPGGATMHAGAFPDHLLSAFEAIAKTPEHKLPKGVPKFKMHACSRELIYGLAQLFGWMPQIQLEGQPRGRIKAGTTLIWELHSDLKVHTYYISYPMRKPGVLQYPMSLEEFRDKYLQAVSTCGDWTRICIKRNNSCLGGSSTNAAVKLHPATTVSFFSGQPSVDSDGDDGVITTGQYFKWILVGASVFLLYLLYHKRRQLVGGYEPL